MRVVAGEARGRRLAVPLGTAVRPTSDRVREAVFNALGSMDLVVGATVLDLFAGSGALGIEALSRGASHAVFVDESRAAVDATQANLAATGLADRARVVRGEAVGWAATAPARFDLALVDPPYAFDGWTALLAALGAEVVVIESDRPVEVPPDWEVVRDRRYGLTTVRIARRLPAPRSTEVP
jgi:16S rRNA (guanine966-N2)-methyltransferase